MDYETLPADYKKTFSRYTKLLKFIGIDFFNSPGITAVSKKRLFLFSIFFFPFVCGQFSLLGKISSDNFLETAPSVPVCVMFALDIIKMTTALLKKSELKQIFLRVGELWPKELLDGDEKADIVKSWKKRIGTLINAFYMYALVVLILFEAMPLLATTYNLCTGVKEYMFPFQIVGWTVDSTVSYVVSYLWMLAASVPCQLCLYVPYDLLMMTMTSNVSVLLRLLQVDLKNSIAIYADGVRRRDMSTSDPESYDKIVRIVKDHQKLLRIAEQLNKIFGLVILIHVAFSAVVICFFGFLAVVVGGLAETIVSIQTVCFSAITIFLLALSGQLLCDSSSGVADAAYQNFWYESDMKVKKLVLFIIIRSHKTCYLSAMGFSSMTLRSFSKIMSSAWTYFSILIQMYEKE